VRSDASVVHGGGAHTPSTLLRVLAFGVLGVILAGAALTVTRPSPPVQSGALPVPLPVDSVAGPVVSGGWWTADTLRDPIVLLYVDEECPWCKKELLTWSERVATTSRVAPVVIVSRGSDPRFVPPPLNRSLIHDRTGAIGRALGLRGVPALAVVTPLGVTHRFYGVSGKSRLDSLLHLLDVPPPHSSPSPEGAIR